MLKALQPVRPGSFSEFGRQLGDRDAHSRRGARGKTLTSALLGADREQLDFKDEGRAAGNPGTALITVGDVGRTDQASFSAHLHLLEAFRPASDDIV